jgi:hypothetical protein
MLSNSTLFSRNRNVPCWNVLHSRQGERARRLFEAEFDFPLAVEAWSTLIDVAAAS